MVNHAPKCVFFTISLLVSFDIALVMENEDFNSVLKQAVQRLLQRHAACTILPVEQRLDVLLDGFPDPSSFFASKYYSMGAASTAEAVFAT